MKPHSDLIAMEFPSCYSARMAKNWKDIELTDDEKKQVKWGQFALATGGITSSYERLEEIQKKRIASGYQQKFVEFLRSHSGRPSIEQRRKWHAENPNPSDI